MRTKPRRRRNTTMSDTLHYREMPAGIKRLFPLYILKHKNLDKKPIPAALVTSTVVGFSSLTPICMGNVQTTLLGCQSYLTATDKKLRKRKRTIWISFCIPLKSHTFLLHTHLTRPLLYEKKSHIQYITKNSIFTIIYIFYSYFQNIYVKYSCKFCSRYISYICHF